jgi:hypothetical protein
MLGETENRFALTRAALSTAGRAKSKFLLSVKKVVRNANGWGIEGPERERARLAYAVLRDGRSVMNWPRRRTGGR